MKKELFIGIAVFLVFLAGCNLAYSPEESSQKQDQIVPEQPSDNVKINSSEIEYECRVDSDCLPEKLIDSKRCWQKSVYTKFNESKCVNNKCGILSSEALTEICDERANQICKAGECIQLESFSCEDSDSENYFMIGYVKDTYGTKHNDFCKDNQTVIEFYCNKEYLANVFNSTYTCENGCERGRCNPLIKVPVIEENTTETNSTGNTTQ